MKTKNRFFKALAVTLIVGAGVIYNMDYPQYINTQNAMISEQITSTTEEAAKSETTVGNLITYTKTVFVTTIKQLISNR